VGVWQMGRQASRQASSEMKERNEKGHKKENVNFFTSQTFMIGEGFL